MANVLIVDDEREYREELYSALANAGYDVMTRGNGFAAIDLGVRLRPEVLIVDWMLKDSIDGLSVSDVLRTVEPRTRVIVMTGFASRDLRDQSTAKNVAEFLDKPFSMGEITSAVRRAAADFEADPVTELPLGVPIGVLELDEDWQCVYANPRARELAGLDQPLVGRDLRTVFRFGSKGLFESANGKWVEMPLSPTGSSKCLMRVREWEDIGARLVLLLHPDDAQCKTHRLVNLLLNQQRVERFSWPYESHVLILDRDPVQRLSMVESLREIGCRCHGAADEAEALRLLRRDGKIQLVIIDREFCGGEMKEMLQGLSLIRERLAVIGTSPAFDRDQFFADGIRYYLQKPWEPADVVGLLKLEKLLR
ncbi:MAG: response regulator [Bdellovibrionota bacterium]